MLYPISNAPHYPTAEQIRNSLKKARLTETELTVEHVEMLLNVLVLDGKIERVRIFLGPSFTKCLLRFSYRPLAGPFGILTPYNLTRSHKTKIPNRNESVRNVVTMMKAAIEGQKRRKNMLAVLRTRMVVPLANDRRSANVLKARMTTMTRTQIPITGRNEERASRPTNPVPMISGGRRGNAPRQMTAPARGLNPNQTDLISQVGPLNASGHHHRLAILSLRVSAEDLYTEH